MQYLFQPPRRRFVNAIAFAAADGDHDDNDQSVIDLVDQPVAGRAELDLVAIAHAAELGCRDARILESLSELFYELIAEVGSELAPFLESILKKFELIGPQAGP